MSFRLYICVSCGYREHIGGIIGTQTWAHCPECGGMDEFGFAMNRLSDKPPRPGMRPAEDIEREKQPCEKPL